MPDNPNEGRCYVYGILVDEGSGPVLHYIGKGTSGTRFKSHMKAARERIRLREQGGRVKPWKLYDCLAHAILKGHEIFEWVIADGLDDERAYTLERELIALIPSDQRWNIFEGGRGPTSDDSRSIWTDELRERQSARLRERWKDSAYRAQMSAQSRAQWDEEKRRLRSEESRAQWQREGFRAKKTEMARDRCTQQWEDGTLRKALGRLWSDDEFRATVSEQRSRRAKALWADEAHARKASERMKAAWVKRRAKGRTPNTVA